SSAPTRAALPPASSPTTMSPSTTTSPSPSPPTTSPSSTTPAPASRWRGRGSGDVLRAPHPPNLPHKGGGAVRWLILDRATTAIEHPPPCGEGWGGGGQVNQSFTVRVTPADQARHPYYYVPVDLPAGTTRLDVTMAYQKADDCIIDLGLFDPRDTGYPTTEGFRGWSGGA